MISTRKLRRFGTSLVVVAAFAVLPAAEANSAPDTALSKEASSACQALTNDLTSGTKGITEAVRVQQPDLAKITEHANTTLKTVLSLSTLGCLPNPLAPVPVVSKQAVDPALPGTALPSTSALPDLSGLLCASPVADLLSQVLALVSSLLKAVTGLLPDLGGLLGQITGIGDTVGGLLSKQENGTSCLPAPSIP